MSLNDKLLKAAVVDSGITPSEHFGVMLYEGNDDSGHSINGGKYGGAAAFNGSSSVITGTAQNVGSSFSVSAWIYPTAYGEKNYFNLWVDSSNLFQIGLNETTNGKLTIAAKHSGTWYVYQTSSSSIISSLNQWYHIVVNRSSSDLKIYVNGSFIESANNYYDKTYNTFNIGSGKSTSNNTFFAGKIDQLRIFAKALSSSEVSTLYAETAATVESLSPLGNETVDTLQVLGDTSCVALYKLENDETDVSGNFNGTGYEVEYGAGRYGQAGSFNASGYIDTGTVFTTMVGSSTSYSVSGWVFPTSTNTTRPFGAEHYNDGWMVETLSDTVKIGSGNGSFYQSSTYSCPRNIWSHICVVITTNSSMALYVNGVLKETLTNAISFNGSNKLFIGADYDSSGAGNPFIGRVDQVRVFNKALSASEVTTLYEENSLVASYRFEGNSSDDRRTYDGTDTNVTYEFGLNFTPDWIWLKPNQSENHNLYDSTRGATKQLIPNSTAGSSTQGNTVQSFDVGGFTTGSDNNTNKSGINYTAWCLKANGGTTSSNSDGTITSTVQTNSTINFSIIKYTGNGSAGATIGHNLGVVPTMFIVKKLTSGTNWRVYHSGIDSTSPQNYNVALNQNAARYDRTEWNDTAPTSSVFSVNDHESVNENSSEYICYAFADTASFSKFGSYIGNGSTNGPIIETGFEPAFLIIRRTDAADQWYMYDNKRTTTNPRNKIFLANATDAELTNTQYYSIDFLSNGFQPRSDVSTATNHNGGEYIFMAFAADPDTETPTVERSFAARTYTGTGNDPLVIDGLNLKPGLVWIKSRDVAREHIWCDIVRGPNKEISSSDTAAEESRGVTSFDNDGFTLDNATSNYNHSGEDYISWVWAADDNEPTLNTTGSLNSLVSVNAAAGFSIIKYTGNATSGATVGHGLSSAPDMVIAKGLSGSSSSWWVRHKSVASTDVLELNANNQKASYSSVFNNTLPSSTVVTLGSGDPNRNNETQIMYCFHDVSGYQKFGTYVGNGGTQTITGVGFQPDFCVNKSTSASSDWNVTDSVRGNQQALNPNSTATEGNQSPNGLTFTSDGFTVTDNSGGGSSVNGNGITYIYWAVKIN